MKLPPEQEAIRDKYFHPSGTFVEFPKEEIEQSIPERFEKIVRLHPSRLAVKMGERALTYDELNKVANQIARAILVRRGQGSEPIALLFEHGIEVVAAIIGVLKAGKFYVAMDIDSPRERVYACFKGFRGPADRYKQPRSNSKAIHQRRSGRVANHRRNRCLHEGLGKLGHRNRIE
jgi:non-ribosomal peptide synthetase component F